ESLAQEREEIAANSVLAQPIPKVSCGRLGITPLPPRPTLYEYLIGFASPSEAPNVKNSVDASGRHGLRRQDEIEVEHDALFAHLVPEPAPAAGESGAREEVTAQVSGKETGCALPVTGATSSSPSAAIHPPTLISPSSRWTGRLIRIRRTHRDERMLLH